MKQNRDSEITMEASAQTGDLAGAQVGAAAGPRDLANGIIATIRRSWQNFEFLAIFLFALSIALPLITFLFVGFGISLWWVIPSTIIISFVLYLAFGRKHIQEVDAARLLNHHHSALEESTELILRPVQQLGFLEKLQVRKVSAALTEIAARDQTLYRKNPGFKKTGKAATLLAISGLLAVGIYFMGPLLRSKVPAASANPGIGINDKAEKILPAITDINVTIAPPAYTGLGNRTQQRLNIKAEQGSKLTWQLKTKGNPSSVQLVFNDSTTTELESLNKEPGLWATEKRINTNGFYQVKIDNVISEFYQLEMIADKQPSIVVQTPRPSTVIEYGQSQQLPLSLVVSDDYGISAANIIATIASGNGEAVKFKEQKLAFNQFKAGARQNRLSKTFNLPSLGIKPGDELYFYISAVDNNKQESRSDIFTVKLEDTSALLSMDGMMSGIDLKPEFFRSQRQIIIETEQLLKGRDTMSKESFNSRCNDLGIDQKLLRLRYGKFLGEESETNIGEEGNTGHDHEGEKEGNEHDDDYDEKISVEDFNNAEKIIDRYAHKHDIAEDATFFDPQTKKDLKAVLAEMWDSELRLRTYKPAEALPYEYKALRLLKELQQKSREYVAKTNTKTTPLKPEKRLTGELDKIVESSNSQTYQLQKQKENVLRHALAVLDDLKENAKPGTEGKEKNKSLVAPLEDSVREILEQAAGELSIRASKDPALYLPSFEAVKRILGDRGSMTDINTTGKAIQRIISQSTRSPLNRQSGPDLKLSGQYFMNLNKSSRGS